MADQSKGLYGTNQFAPEAWSQFMTAQTPMVQNMMNSYVEQSKSLFSQMQDKMQDQTRAMFSTFPFPPGTSGEKGKN
jgi:polyhydroxyalkanoate synthesis regulator protein